jgi:hypothetical protein
MSDIVRYPDHAVPIPVQVVGLDQVIANTAPAAKNPFVKNTSLKTYVLDPAGLVGAGKYAQISDFEPRRIRMAIYVVDVAVALTMEQPVTSPDTTSASAAPQGLYMPPRDNPYEFFGPDAFWLNSLTAVTRVSVVKEYC